MVVTVAATPPPRGTRSRHTSASTPRCHGAACGVPRGSLPSGARGAGHGRGGVPVVDVGVAAAVSAGTGPAIVEQWAAERVSTPAQWWVVWWSRGAREAPGRVAWWSAMASGKAGRVRSAAGVAHPRLGARRQARLSFSSVAVEETRC